MVAVKNSRNRVVVSHLWVGFAVFEERTHGGNAAFELFCIFAWGSKVKVSQLQECLQVLYRGVAVDGLRFVADTWTYANRFSAEHSAELDVVELAHSCIGNGTCKHVEVQCIGVGVERCAAFAEETHADLVFCIVCRLHINLYAVAQYKLLCTELAPVLLALYLAFLRQFVYEFFSCRLLLVRFVLLCLRIEHIFLKGLCVGNGEVGLIGRIYRKHLVLV